MKKFQTELISMINYSLYFSHKKIIIMICYVSEYIWYSIINYYNVLYVAQNKYL